MNDPRSTETEPSDTAMDFGAGQADPAGQTSSEPSSDDARPARGEINGEQASRNIPALDVETLVGSLEAVTAERDAYLADLQRVTAEFANFRRQATKRQSDTVQHAAIALVDKLLPVLDACDAAVAQGASDVEPIHGALLDILRKEGLEVVADAGTAFDPERHEAVMHQEGDGGEPTVAEVMRSGYVWNGRVLRPAMVRVEG